jgi:cardiolipin synthase C
MSRLAVLLGVPFLLLLGGCASLAPQPRPDEPATSPAVGAQWEDLARVRSDDWFLPLNSGDDALAWRLRAIRSAQASIDLQTFLWLPDRVGRVMMDELRAAADRGVRVRILLDDSFTMHEGLALRSLDAHPSIALRIYNPFRHRPDNVVLRQLFNAGEFSRVNHRMHNKLLVVDGRAAIVGGRNLADEYFGLHAGFNFRDMEVLGFGEHVRAAAGEFDRYWNSRWAFPLDEALRVAAAAVRGDEAAGAIRAAAAPAAPALAAAPAGVAAEPPDVRAAAWRDAARNAPGGQATMYFDEPATDDPADRREAPVQLAQRLLELLDRARSEIWLVSAYLVPTPELEAALTRAERRGVAVRILTNSLKSNNHLAAYSAYRKHLQSLVEHGADVHEVRIDAADRGRYMLEPLSGKRLGLHAKLVLVDRDVTFVGSANLDPRSLRLNTEMGLVIEGAELNARLRRELADDFLPANAWRLSLGRDGRLAWVGDAGESRTEPDESPFDRLEDWFLGALPIEGQM